MRILTYKRTHIGDPDSAGQFGINDCMGRVRGWDFDAVIGVGGLGNEPKAQGISGRVTWVGLNPRWSPHPRGWGCVVRFEHFRLLDGQGPMLQALSPLLARRMYEKKARVLLTSYSRQEKAEATELIQSILGLPSISTRRVECRKSRCGNLRNRKSCDQQSSYSLNRTQTRCTGCAD